MDKMKRAGRSRKTVRGESEQKQPDRHRKSTLAKKTHLNIHKGKKAAAYQDGFEAGFAKGFEDGHHLKYSNQV